MVHALAERYPGTAALPRAGVADLPTPLDPLGGDLRTGSLSVKRDDLTSRAYGGNKVRKLDFFLGEALAERRRAVVTFGAYGSNHALATAVHARAVGIEPHAVLSRQPPTACARATLLAHAAIGTRLHPIDGWDGGAEAARVVRELTERDGLDPLVIPMGGSAPLGVLSFVDAALELLEETEPDFVYAAAGTLGTAVGLALGFAAARAKTVLVTARVTPRTVANEAVLAGLARETVALLRSLDPSFPELSRPDLRFELREEFFEPGYAEASDEVEAAVAKAGADGLKLESTYTGKAFAALLADAAAGRLARRDVVFWDTYNSAPLPAPGPVKALPEALREYVADCERRFGSRE